jgi:RNA polymerase subunit RPABC4/transcription elongation factor Spt4
MSYDDICRECEYNISNDAELCLDCAESKFVDLMRDKAVLAL